MNNWKRSRVKICFVLDCCARFSMVKKVIKDTVSDHLQDPQKVDVTAKCIEIWGKVMYPL